MARRPDAFLTIRTEGGILPSSVLQSIAALEADHLDPASFHLPVGERVQEAIERSWSRMLATWSSFRKALETDTSESATSLTRERWLLPLFHELSFGRLPPAAGFTIEARSYPISHAWGRVPIHLIGAKVDLDKRTRGVVGAATASPHGLVQDFLNKSDDHLWGIVSNGLTLRLLRDHASLTRQALVEFDLEEMFEGQARTDFALLWLVLHQSRFEGARPEESIIERWSQEGSKKGVRALDDLRKQVQEAITALGAGFLAPAGNAALRDSLKEPGAAQEYYRELLRLVYRLIFLFVAEDRDLLHPPDTNRETRQRYARWYSTRRLRDLSRTLRGSRHVDLWRQFRMMSESLRETGNPSIGLPAMGGFLWSHEACPRLQVSDLDNGAFLDALRHLSFLQEGRTVMPVDWRNLGAEELGSVYESLLELHPVIHGETARFELSSEAGNERRTTSSYYTSSGLIRCLLDAALMPVLDEATKAPDPEPAVLALRICDPACGSGHFLVSAANRIARRLASIRTGDDEPSPGATRRALRDVIGRCIYGVDLNPMAVELCKVSLWMEALEPGRPLSFLDHRIRVGNSLLGVTPARISKGIPDAAFETLDGDDTRVVRDLRKRNRDARKGQATLFAGTFTQGNNRVSLGERSRELDHLDDSALAGVQVKEVQFRTIQSSPERLHAKAVADAWCSAFLSSKAQGCAPVVTQDVLSQIVSGDSGVSVEIAQSVDSIAKQYRLFHWHVEYPEINDRGGFDCVIGNPPYLDSENMSRLMPRERHLISETHESASGNWDIYIPFVECSLRILSPGGLQAMLTPMQIIASDYAANLHALLLRNTLLSCLDLSAGRFFADASVSVVSLCARKMPADPNSQTRFVEFGSDLSIMRTVSVATETLQRLPAGYIGVPLRLKHQELLEWMKCPRSIQDCASVGDGATTAEAYKLRALVFEANSSIEGEDEVRLVNTGTIDPFLMLWGVKEIRYLGFTGLRPVIARKDLKSISVKRLDQALTEKVLVAGMASRLEAVACPAGVLCGKSAAQIIPDRAICPAALALVLNSAQINELYIGLFGSRGFGGGSMNIGPRQIEQLPLPGLHMLARYSGDKVDRAWMLRMTSASDHEVLREVQSASALSRLGQFMHTSADVDDVANCHAIGERCISLAYGATLAGM